MVRIDDLLVHVDGISAMRLDHTIARKVRFVCLLMTPTPKLTT